jgi:hypothetical protein
MPIVKSVGCWKQLDQISQTIGQINGTAYQCGKWNVPALLNLRDQTDNLMNAYLPDQNCPPMAIRSTWKAPGDPGPIFEINQIVYSLLGDDDMTPEEIVARTEELEKEEVGRVAANATVGEIQSQWSIALDGLADWFRRDPLEGYEPTRWAGRES